MVMRCIFRKAKLAGRKSKPKGIFENVILLPKESNGVQRKQLLWLWECVAIGGTPCGAFRKYIKSIRKEG